MHEEMLAVVVADVDAGQTSSSTPEGRTDRHSREIFDPNSSVHLEGSDSRSAE